MKTTGHMDVFSLDSIDFVADDCSLRLHIVDSLPPYAASTLRIVNVLSIQLFRCPGAAFPLTVVDLTWQFVEGRVMSEILDNASFPFRTATSEPLSQVAKLVSIRLEGDLTGTIIGEEFEVL